MNSSRSILLFVLVSSLASAIVAKANSIPSTALGESLSADLSHASLSFGSAPIPGENFGINTSGSIQPLGKDKDGQDDGDDDGDDNGDDGGDDGGRSGAGVPDQTSTLLLSALGFSALLLAFRRRDAHQSGSV